MKNHRFKPPIFFLKLLLFCSFAVILHVSLKIVDHQLITNHQWAGFLTWRLPILMASSSILTALICAQLNSRKAVFFQILDHSLWVFSPIGLLVQITAPNAPDPQIWFGVFYLGLFAVKALMIGSSLLLLQRKRPVNTLLLFFVFTWFFGMFGAWHAPVHPVHGDEPHYLLMTHSLVRDADLNLFNEYTDEVYRVFHPSDLEPKLSDFQTAGQIYSRGLGATFPLLLAPSYALGGYKGSQIFIMLCTALLMTQLYLLLMKSVPQADIVLLSVFLVATTCPILHYSSLIYPDIPAALLIVLGLRALQIPPLSKAGRSVPSYLFIICTVLIFLKFRYFIPVILIMVPLVRREMIRLRNSMTFLITSLVMIGSYFAADLHFFDGDLFTNRFGGTHQVLSYMPTMQSFKVIPGLLIDQEAGLWFFAPVYLLAVAGIFLHQGKRDSLYWFALLGIPLTALSLLGHFAWHCMPTPPLRYLLPVLCPTAFFISQGLMNYRKRSLLFRSISSLCIALSWLSSWLLTLNPAWQINLADGTNIFLEHVAEKLNAPVPLYFPSAIRPGPAFWFWSVACLLLLMIFIRPEWRDSRNRARTTAPSFLIACGLICCGLIASFGLLKGVRDYHLEDRYWVKPTGGSFFPENRDPFFHQEHDYGWAVAPESSVIIPLMLSEGDYTAVIRCRLTNSWLPQRLRIKTADTFRALVTVTSKEWTRYAIKMHDLSPGQVISIDAAERNSESIAVDYIKLIPVSSWKSGFWQHLASVSRGWINSGLTLRFTQKAMLTFPGNPWYQLRSYFQSGATSLPPEDAKQNPLPESFFEMIRDDMLLAGWDKTMETENLFDFSIRNSIQAEYKRDYVFKGVEKGHPPAVRYLALNSSDSESDDALQLHRAMAFHLSANPHKAALQIDNLLTKGNHYPMRTGAPANHLDSTHPLYPILYDMQMNSRYVTSAEYHSKQHLVKSVEYYHAGDLRTASVHFDNFYLSDYALFLETVPEIDPTYVSKMFDRASRIHLSNVRQFVEVTLSNHRHLSALAASRYGLRMNPSDRDLHNGLTRALFYMGDYWEARRTCLQNAALFHEDDQSRWLLELIAGVAADQRRLSGGTHTDQNRR